MPRPSLNPLESLCALTFACLTGFMSSIDVLRLQHTSKTMAQYCEEDVRRLLKILVYPTFESCPYSPFGSHIPEVKLRTFFMNPDFRKYIDTATQLMQKPDGFKIFATERSALGLLQTVSETINFLTSERCLPYGPNALASCQSYGPVAEVREYLEAVQHCFTFLCTLMTRLYLDLCVRKQDSFFVEGFNVRGVYNNILIFVLKTLKSKEFRNPLYAPIIEMLTGMFQYLHSGKHRSPHIDTLPIVISSSAQAVAHRELGDNVCWCDKLFCSCSYYNSTMTIENSRLTVFLLGLVSEFYELPAFHSPESTLEALEQMHFALTVISVPPEADVFNGIREHLSHVVRYIRTLDLEGVLLLAQIIMAALKIYIDFDTIETLDLEDDDYVEARSDIFKDMINATIITEVYLVSALADEYPDNTPPLDIHMIRPLLYRFMSKHVNDYIPIVTPPDDFRGTPIANAYNSILADFEEQACDLA